MITTMNSWHPTVLQTEKKPLKREHQYASYKLQLKYMDIDIGQDLEMEFCLQIFLMDLALKEIIGGLQTIEVTASRRTEGMTTRFLINKSLYLNLNDDLKTVVAVINLLHRHVDSLTDYSWCTFTISEENCGRDLSFSLMPGSVRCLFIPAHQQSSLNAQGVELHLKCLRLSSDDELIPEFPTNTLVDAGAYDQLHHMSRANTLFANETPSCKLLLENIQIFGSKVEFDKLEEEFCGSLQGELSVKYNLRGTVDSGAIIILDRLLRVFSHNGYTWKDPIPVVPLDLYHKRSDTLSAHGEKTTNLLGRMHLDTDETYLIARNPVQHILPCSKEQAIVFVLEYIVGFPVNSRTDTNTNNVVSKTVSYTFRWGAFVPFPDAELSSGYERIHIPLNGLIDHPKAMPTEYLFSGDHFAFEEYLQELCAQVCPNGHLCARDDMNENARLVLTAEVRFDQMKQRPENQFPLENAESITPNRSTVVEQSYSRREQTAVHYTPQLFKSKTPSPIRSRPISRPRSMHETREVMTSPFLLAQSQPSLHQGRQKLPDGFGSAMFNGEEASTKTLANQRLDVAPKGNSVIIVSKPASRMLNSWECSNLHSFALEQISTARGQDTEEITSEDSLYKFDLRKEEEDPMSGNEIIFDFHAISRPNTPSTAQLWEEIYFTFQFYRFPQVVTETLISVEDTTPKSNSNWYKLRPASGVQDNTYRVTFRMDYNQFKPGELAMFCDYLLQNQLQIDLWNARSHLPLGTTCFATKHLCRQGREGIQVNLVLDVLPHVDSPFHNHESPLCQLHLRIANIGYRSNESVQNESIHRPAKKFPYSHSNVQHSIEDEMRRPLSTLSTDASGNVVRAKRVVDSNPELFAFSESNENTTDPKTQKQLNRLYEALKRANHRQLSGHTRLSCVKIQCLNDVTDLRAIQAYREKKKRETILAMLDDKSNTSDHILNTSFGRTELFEFELKNSGFKSDRIRIEIQDTRQCTELLTDPDELDAMKFSGKHLPQHLGDGMILVEPGDTVSVPFKYTEMSILPQQLIALQTSRKPQKLHCLEQQITNEKIRQVKILFKSTTSGQIVVQFNVEINLHPAPVTQTFRTFHQESVLMRKVLRLPITDRQYFQGHSQMWFRVSDASVTLESEAKSYGQPTDISIQTQLKRCPEIKEFFLACYTEAFQARPTHLWHLIVHTCNRVDLLATIGEVSKPLGLSLSMLSAHSSLVGSRSIAVYTTHPGEVILGKLSMVDPNERRQGLTFMASKDSSPELQVRLCPSQAGSHHFLVTAIDVQADRVLQIWILNVQVQASADDKVFKLDLPVLSDGACQKRIAYTNPHSIEKIFYLKTDREDLLRFKESKFKIPAGGTKQLALEFQKPTEPTDQTIHVFLTDERNTLQDMFTVNAHYT